MDMPGMMGEGEMADLEGLQGAEFDLAFVEMMTAHHEGAIQMAEQVLQDGQNAEVAQLGTDIIEAQEAEIEQMAVWQEEWS